MIQMTSIQIDVDDERYEKLSTIKNRHGMTWTTLLIEGARHVEECETSLDDLVGDDDAV